MGRHPPTEGPIVELRHLRSFLAVAEAGNVTRAAARCFIAQSAMSAQIAQLEAELGNPLFVRSPRGVRLTAAGETLVPRAAKLLADGELIAQEQAQLRGVVRGRLRLGVIQSPPPHLDVVKLALAYHESYPDVELSVRTGASDDLVRDVASGDLDAALVAVRTANPPSGTTLTPLFDDPLVGVVASTVAPRSGRRIGVARLIKLGSFIHYRRGSGLRHSVEAAFERADVQVDARFEMDQMADMLRLVAAGAGVTILPSSVLSVPGVVAADSIALLSLSDPLALHVVSIVLSDPPSPTVQAFRTMLDR